MGGRYPTNIPNSPPVLVTEHDLNRNKLANLYIYGHTLVKTYSY